MPSNFKDLVRARMQKTGESWSTAARHVRNQAPLGTRPTPIVPSGDAAVSGEEDARRVGAREGAAAFQEWSDAFESMWVEGGYSAPESEMIRDAVRGEFGTRAEHERDVRYDGIEGAGIDPGHQDAYFGAYFAAFYDAFEHMVAHAEATADHVPYRERMPPEVAEAIDDLERDASAGPSCVTTTNAPTQPVRAGVPHASDVGGALPSGSRVAVRLEPLRQWTCDACGQVIEKPREGTVTYDYVLGTPPTDRHANFRIVHNGNANGGGCQGEARADILLEDLRGERGISRMLGRQSNDPSWAETVRRVTIPHYEEARHWFSAARADGWEIIEDKLSVEKLVAIIGAYTG